MNLEEKTNEEASGRPQKDERVNNNGDTQVLSQFEKSQKMKLNGKNNHSEKEKEKEKDKDKDNKNKRKFTIDLSDEDSENSFNFLMDFYRKANDKPYGRKVELKEIILKGLHKLNEDDLTNLQELTLGKMDKIHLLHEKYNLDNNCHLSFDEYLCQQLKIQ